MSEFVTVAKVGTIPEGRGETYTVNGRLVAVFNTGEGYHAIDDLCPHMGASLGAGPVPQGVVTLPLACLAVQRVCTGAWCDNPKVKTDRI